MHGSPRLAIGLRQVTPLLLAAALAAGSTAALTTAANADSNAVAAKKKKCKKAGKRSVAAKKKCKKGKSPITVPPPGTPPGGSTPSGAPAVLSITPTSKDFGNVGIDTASPPQTFVVTNSGGLSGTVTFTTSGEDPEQFQVSHDLCSGSTLPTGGTCSLDVEFHPHGLPEPTGLGPKSAILTVDAPGTSTSASLSGFGTP